MTKSDDREKADVFDFVDAYLSDLERGTERPLNEWLERFPHSPDSIAREWLALRATRNADGATTSDAPSPEPGDAQRVGPYRLLRELGRGGQGAVWLAEDTRIARRVALKLLASRFDVFSEESIARFRREAEVIARLEHPSLCTIYEADVDGKTPYIAMRFVEGQTLAELLAESKRAESAGQAPSVALESSPDDRTPPSSTHFPPKSALDIHGVLLLFERAARALHAAHEAGVIHRDVKPGNIIVTPDGKPVLLDFGLARDETSQVESITQSGDVFGTPAYMSPEQLVMKSVDLDRRTDVYSLGVALYEALTLQRPFERAAKGALYAAIQNEPPPDPRRKNRELGEDVKVVLETALEKDRARRYATALELAEDLRRIREYEPIHARPASVPLRFARWTQRHPALAVAIIGTILSLSTGLVITLHLLAQRDTALRVALGRHLMGRSLELVPEDPSAALALGIEGVEAAEMDPSQPDYSTRSDLFPALDACWLANVLAADGEKARGTDIALSTDGRTTVTAFDDGEVIAWETLTGKSLGRYECGALPVARVTFAGDGSRVAVASADAVRVFATGGASPVRTAVASIPGAAAWIEFLPDATALLVVSRDGGIRVVEAAGGAQRVALAVNGAQYERARATPDGAWILASGSHAVPALFDAHSGARVRELDLTRGTFVDLSGGGPTRIVAACADGHASILDVPSGVERARTVRLEPAPAFACASPDGTCVCVLCGHEDEGAAFVWDPAAGGVHPLTEKSARRVNAAVFSPDGSRLALASIDNTIRIYDPKSRLATRRIVQQFRPVDIRWSGDGRRIVSSTVAGFAHVWFALTRPDSFDLEGHGGAVRSATFSPDGALALTACDDGAARLWRLPSSGGSSRSGPRADTEVALIATMRHAAPLVRAEFSADGGSVLTIGTDDTVGVWNGSSGAPVRPMITLQTPIVGVAIDTRGERVACACADGVARVWNTRDAGSPVELLAPRAPLACIQFSENGALVAVGLREEDQVRVHDARTGALASTIRFVHNAKVGGIGVVDVAFRPNAAEIAAACGDQRMRTWRAGDGENILDLPAFVMRGCAFSRDGTRMLAVGRRSGAVRSFEVGVGGAGGPVSAGTSPQAHADVRGVVPKNLHTDALTSASYSPDGTLVLTTSRDRSAYVWNSASGATVAHHRGFASAVLCGALAFDGERLRAIVGCEDGRACIWPVDPLPAAKARKPRELLSWEKERERKLALPLEYR